jgi:CheY-like chemotaxis protein
MKVLVVDDTGLSRLIVQRTLERFAHEVVTASSGQEALRCLELDPNIGLVISDLMMPGMDGIEFIKQARKLERAAGENPVTLPPFILLTATHEKRLIQEACRAGFADIMLKPLDPGRLLTAIEDHCGPRRGQSAKRSDCSDALQALEKAFINVVQANDCVAAARLRNGLEATLEKIDAFLERSKK